MIERKRGKTIGREREREKEKIKEKNVTRQRIKEIKYLHLVSILCEGLKITKKI